MKTARSFRTKNQLKVNTYLFVVLMTLALTILFLAVGSFGNIISWFDLDGRVEAQHQSDDIIAKGSQILSDDKTEGAGGQTASASSFHVTFCGSSDTLNLLREQCGLLRVGYTVISSVSEADADAGLLVLDVNSAGADDLAALQNLVNEGVNIWFLSVPEAAFTSSDFRDLMGITEIGGWSEYPGLRSSSKILSGVLFEDPEQKVACYDITLGQQTKIYSCALPKHYEQYDDEDLPPLIWRYIAGDTGAVYVCNGNFVRDESAYGFLPMILKEINSTDGSFLYPIINAWCMDVDGYPYAADETRDNWTRLYGRTGRLIMQDMLQTQFSHYAQVYHIKLSFFSDDAELFRTTDDYTLSYYYEEIEADGGTLDDKANGNMVMRNGDEGVCLIEWTPSFTFVNPATGYLQLPVNDIYTTENQSIDTYAATGSIVGLGYYALSQDIGDFLDYSGDRDIWMDYCAKLETILGVQEESYSWLDRVTAREALNRVYRYLTETVEITYEEDCIKVTAGNSTEDSWFILQTRQEDLSIDGGTLEQIGEGTYLVTVPGADAVITWEAEK